MFRRNCPSRAKRHVRWGTGMGHKSRLNGEELFLIGWGRWYLILAAKGVPSRTYGVGSIPTRQRLDSGSYTRVVQGDIGEFWSFSDT